MGFGRKRTSFRLLDRAADGATFDDVVALSSEVIESVAPQELDLLPIVAEEFRREPSAALGRPARPEPVADGFDYPAISALVVAIGSILAGLAQSGPAQGALGNVLGNALDEPIRRTLGWAFGAKRPGPRHGPRHGPGAGDDLLPRRRGAQERPSPLEVRVDVRDSLSITLTPSDEASIHEAVIRMTADGQWPREAVITVTGEWIIVIRRRLESQ